MKNFYLALFAVLLFPFLSQAQSNYKPGYIVTLKGDTIHGFIDYREWNSNPTAINFKKDIAVGQVLKYTPSEIGYFNIKGLEQYKRYSGTISMDATDANRVTNGKDTSFRIDTVFLKVLQVGNKISLYSYSDGLKDRFYVGNSPEYIPTELVYHIYTNSNATTQISATVVEKTFARQLFALAQEHNVLTDDLQKEIGQADYNKSDILKITSKINGVTQAEYAKIYDAPLKVTFYAGVALNITNTNPFASLKTQGVQSSTSYLPAVLLGISIPANPNTGKLLFRVEALFADGTYKFNVSNANVSYVYTSYSFNTFSASLAPQVIYNIYNAADLKFYMGAGFKFTFNKYADPEYKQPNGSSVKGSSEAFNGYVGFGTPVIIKAGAVINKKFEIYADYQTPTPLSHDDSFPVNISAVQLGLNYFFN